MSTAMASTLQRTEPEGTGAPRPQGRWIEALSHLDPAFGGLSSVVPQLGSQLVLGEKVPVEIAAFCAAGEASSLAGYPELTLSRWPMSPHDWMRDRVQEGELQRRWRSLLSTSEGVHIHGLWETSTRVAAHTARALRKPYIVSAHGMLEPWALANKAWKKRIYGALIERANLRGATCLHALTQAEAEDYRRFGCKGPIAVIPNGVSPQVDARPELFYEAFPQTRGRRLLLFLGRIHFKKGLDLLIPAWAALAARFPDALLVLAGPDSENSRAAAEVLVARHNLNDRVLFTGMLRGEIKWSALRAAEGFVLPSYSEGLSIATLEAMGMGLPVIITTNCHLPEVSTAGAGWEIEANAPALQAAIEEMLGNPWLAVERGVSGQQLVRERFSWEPVGRQMAELYRWAAEGVRPRTFTLQEGV